MPVHVDSERGRVRAEAARPWLRRVMRSDALLLAVGALAAAVVASLLAPGGLVWLAVGGVTVVGGLTLAYRMGASTVVIDIDGITVLRHGRVRRYLQWGDVTQLQAWSGGRALTPAPGAIAVNLAGVRCEVLPTLGGSEALQLVDIARHEELIPDHVVVHETLEGQIADERRAAESGVSGWWFLGHVVAAGMLAAVGIVVVSGWPVAVAGVWIAAAAVRYVWSSGPTHS